jgi:hypothetical protein
VGALILREGYVTGLELTGTKSVIREGLLEEWHV